MNKVSKNPFKKEVKIGKKPEPNKKSIESDKNEQTYSRITRAELNEVENWNAKPQDKLGGDLSLKDINDQGLDS